MSPQPNYELSDRYTAHEGAVFLNGTQVLARIALDQAHLDRTAGRNTGGFITGYRGSPITSLDREIASSADLFEAAGIVHKPALNEDLAATAIWGTQQLAQNPARKHEGVFGLWYGKGPGLDRSMDAIRHGAAYGASESGGVVLLVGDDHGASSSTVAHQSETMLSAAHIPVLHPATLEELREFGLAAIEISRRSGAWVALKCQTELLETSARVDLDASLPVIGTPELPSANFLYARNPEPPLDAEKRHQPRLTAVQQLVYSASLDRITSTAKDARLGIVATGKAWLDLCAAFELLGLDPEDCNVRVWKPALTWPLEPLSAIGFAEGLEQFLVVEEKGALTEIQLRVIFSERLGPQSPRIIGKRDQNGNDLIPQTGVLDPVTVAGAVSAFLGVPAVPCHKGAPVFDLPRRRPFLCAGCPHNTSTNLPRGSRAFAGIGCHSMVIGLNRATDAFTQMGAEGVTWQGQAPFTDEKHVFANMGDGTYFHSGILAIRSAVAAGQNITYKVLFNDAVAMTGGQPHDGALSPLAIVSQLKAEGVGRTVLVAKDPDVWRKVRLPDGVELLGRDDLNRISKELRETPGVTAIVYDQMCATELRRRRKRGRIETPPERAFINPLVCEGCGDCTIVSNCVAVEPLDTWQGRKRQINQSVCNIDLSCIKGFCPSFVTVTGSTPKRVNPKRVNALLDGLTLPEPKQIGDGHTDILIAGIGGTGVLTVSGVIGMAAFLQGRPVTLLDQSGLAQKNGAVRSHIRIGKSATQLKPSRIGASGAHTLLACDAFAASDAPVLNHVEWGRTVVVVNTSAAPPVEFLTDRSTDTSAEAALDAIEQVAGNAATRIDARELASRYFGEAALANVILLGAAWQLGRVPLALSSLERAITLNGVAVDDNLAAFALGRVAVAMPEALQKPELQHVISGDLEQRISFLTDYQNTAWAERFADMVKQASARETELTGAEGSFTRTVMKNAFRLMSYKDEYEVARLHLSTEFDLALRNEFGDDISVKHHLAPPMLFGGKDMRGYPLKRKFGSWIRPVFSVLTRMKGLRGTFADPFGQTAERRMERGLIADYDAMIRDMLPNLRADLLPEAIALANLPDTVRGFGPIKEKSVADMRVQKDKLQAEFDTALKEKQTYKQPEQAKGAER
jgi:indolepyruvate ferredoxin oxidoreductase